MKKAYYLVFVIIIISFIYLSSIKSINITPINDSIYSVALVETLETKDSQVKAVQTGSNSTGIITTTAKSEIKLEDFIMVYRCNGTSYNSAAAYNNSTCASSSTESRKKANLLYNACKVRAGKRTKTCTYNICRSSMTNYQFYYSQLGTGTGSRYSTFWGASIGVCSAISYTLENPEDNCSNYKMERCTASVSVYEVNDGCKTENEETGECEEYYKKDKASGISLSNTYESYNHPACKECKELISVTAPDFSGEQSTSFPSGWIKSNWQVSGTTQASNWDGSNITATYLYSPPSSKIRIGGVDISIGPYFGGTGTKSFRLYRTIFEVEIENTQVENPEMSTAGSINVSGTTGTYKGMSNNFKKTTAETLQKNEETKIITNENKTYYKLDGAGCSCTPPSLVIPSIPRVPCIIRECEDECNGSKDPSSSSTCKQCYEKNCTKCITRECKDECNGSTNPNSSNTCKECFVEKCNDGDDLEEKDYYYRPITLTNPFPDRNGKIGANWKRWINNEENKKRLETTYFNEESTIRAPEYVITLTNDSISWIKDYNDKKDNVGGYSDEFTNKYGNSSFLEEYQQKFSSLYSYNTTEYYNQPGEAFSNYNLGCGPNSNHYTDDMKEWCKKR